MLFLLFSGRVWGLTKILLMEKMSKTWGCFIFQKKKFFECLDMTKLIIHFSRMLSWNKRKQNNAFFCFLDFILGTVQKKFFQEFSNVFNCGMFFKNCFFPKFCHRGNKRLFKFWCSYRSMKKSFTFWKRKFRREFQRFLHISSFSAAKVNYQNFQKQRNFCFNFLFIFTSTVSIDFSHLKFYAAIEQQKYVVFNCGHKLKKCLSVGKSIFEKT